MAESPTSEQVRAERPDIQNYIDGNDANLDIDDYIARALAQVKRDIEDKKGIKWSMVYNGTTLDYFLDEDDEAHNKDRLHNAIVLLAAAYVFKDYAITRTDDGVWNSMYLSYRSDYDRAIEEMKLSVDWDESGAISEGEEENTTQVFLGQ
jgi:hypothetical protein